MRRLRRVNGSGFPTRCSSQTEHAKPHLLNLIASTSHRSLDSSTRQSSLWDTTVLASIADSTRASEVGRLSRSKISACRFHSPKRPSRVRLTAPDRVLHLSLPPSLSPSALLVGQSCVFAFTVELLLKQGRLTSLSLAASGSWAKESMEGHQINYLRWQLQRVCFQAISASTLHRLSSPSLKRLQTSFSSCRDLHRHRDRRRRLGTDRTADGGLVPGRIAFGELFFSLLLLERALHLKVVLRVVKTQSQSGCKGVASREREGERTLCRPHSVLDDPLHRPDRSDSSAPAPG